MRTTTFVSGITNEIPAHPGRIPPSGSATEVFEAWESALRAHEIARDAAEKSRKFSGRASDESIRRWAHGAGIVGDVRVHVVVHSGQIKWGAHTDSVRAVSL